MADKKTHSVTTTKGVVIEGNSVAAGKTVKVTEADARYLIACGSAKAVEAKAKKEA